MSTLVFLEVPCFEVCFIPNMQKAATRKAVALPLCLLQGMMSDLLSASLFDIWAKSVEKGKN